MLQDSSFIRLRVFCEVVESQGFRTASERLHMSQPAISTHIQALEKQFQIVLLERGRFTKVTDAGAIFYRFAKETLENAAKISRELNDLRSANFGRVSVASGSTIGRYIMPSVFSEFKRAEPHVEMILRIGNQSTVCEMILNREIDIGFIFTNSPLNGLIGTTIAKTELVCMVGTNHPLANRETVSSQDLSPYPFILPANSIEVSEVQRFFELKGIEINEILMISESSDTNKKFIKDNKGISVMLITSVFDDIRDKKLIKLNLAFEPYYINLLLVTHPNKHISPMQNKFIKFCSKTIPQMKYHQST